LIGERLERVAGAANFKSDSICRDCRRSLQPL